MSVLTSTHFNVPINNLEADVNIKTFTLKVWKILSYSGQREKRNGKEELIGLKDQAIKWQLKFRVNKCEIKHMAETTQESHKTEPAVPTQEQDSEVMIFSFIKH